MIFHILKNDKFTYDYIKRINSIFGQENHRFLICGNLQSNKIKEAIFPNMVQYDQIPSKSRIPYVIDNISKSKQIIVHSLYYDRLMIVLVSLASVVWGRKMFWNIWGGDLYNQYETRNNSIPLRCKDILKRIFVWNISGIGYIPGDYRFLKTHYRSKAKFFLNSYTYDFPEVRNSEHSGLNILLGNSATIACRYEDAINKLVNVIDDNTDVYCILSYGYDDYRKKIYNYGKKKLGDRFHPVIEYMSYDEYMDFLGKMDIAVFNHNRQQGLGNIAAMLFLGKKVFVSEKNACKEYFEKCGCILYDIELLTNKDSLRGLDDEEKNKNRAAILDYFSDKQFGYRWRRIFERRV